MHHTDPFIALNPNKFDVTFLREPASPRPAHLRMIDDQTLLGTLTCCVSSFSPKGAIDEIGEYADAFPPFPGMFDYPGSRLEKMRRFSATNPNKTALTVFARHRAKLVTASAVWLTEYANPIDARRAFTRFEALIGHQEANRRFGQIDPESHSILLVAEDNAAPRIKWTVTVDLEFFSRLPDVSPGLDARGILSTYVARFLGVG